MNKHDLTAYRRFRRWLAKEYPGARTDRFAIAMARDSAETACQAPVPKDCQARAESIAQPQSGITHD